MIARPWLRYAAIYGGLAGAIACAVIVASLAFALPDHFHSEVFGYLVMLVALSMVFVGIKRYRDVERGGVIGFLGALGVGVGISVVAALIYVIGWETYQGLSGVDFIGDYTASVVADMRASGASAAKIAATEAEMRDLAVNYRNPLFRLPMTFAEIFPVGLLMALISAAILRNPRAFPARSQG